MILMYVLFYSLHTSCLTEINSRCYELLLMRILTQGPYCGYSVCYKGGWEYLQPVMFLHWKKKKSFLLKYYSSVLLFIECQPGIHKFVLQPNTVNSRLMDTSLVGTPCWYGQLLNPRRNLQTFHWNKLLLLQTLTIIDACLSPNSAILFSNSCYNGDWSASFNI